MSKSTVQDGLSEILKDEKSLEEFIEAMKDFNQAFCDAMAGGVDFTIKLEVHGDQGIMLHARVLGDRWRRPNTAGRYRGKKEK
jgi:hypothetical protein